MAETIKIGGELESTATGNVVAAASAIKDKVKNKYQGEINAETETILTRHENEINGSGGLDKRLQTIEALAEISVGGGDIGIGTAADFESEDPEDQAKVPTVAAMLGGANDGVYDISARHSGATYADLAAALGTNGANVPAGVRRGGMSVKFVRTYDNNYIRYNLISDSFTTDITKWAIDDGGIYVENPEWLYVILDNEKHILGGIKTDGHVEWSKGVPTPIKEYVSLQITNSISSKVDKVTGKSLIDADYANNVSYIDCDEYLYILLDNQNHILEAITSSGEYINNLSSNGGNTSDISAEIPKSAGEYSLGHSDLDGLQYDYNVIIINGQSLSVGSETSVARQTVGNDYCYMLGNNIWVGVNENPVAGATLHKLVSGAINNVPQENCLTTAVLSLSEKLANDGTPKKFIAISVGQGGASIEELMKGASSGYYANRFLSGITRLKAIADSENKTIGVFSIVWMQGESNHSTPTSEYKTKLQQLRNDMVSDIATVFEQTTIPAFLMYGSFSRLFFDYDPQIAMQELAAENNSMFMSNPIYNIPAYRYGHLSSNGCVWFGEYIAKSLYALSHNEEPHIMRILGAYFINETTIVVKIDTPVLPIVFDTATWASVQNYGFAVFKDGTEVTISSVENMGNEVIIKLQNDRVEGSTYRLEYVKESARADVRYGNVRDSSKYSPLYKYANDANEVGSNLYTGWSEESYDSGVQYTEIVEGEYPTVYHVGDHVSENVNGTMKYFVCTAETQFPPYAYVSNRPQNISAGDKFSLYNWLIPFKGNIN